MADHQELFESVIDASLFDTYLIYALVGALIFIVCIGVLILLVTSYCCLYGYFCCYRRHRYSSYELNEKRHEEQNQPKVACVPVDETYPYLVNQNPLTSEQIESNYAQVNTKGKSRSPRALSVSSVPTTHYDRTNPRNLSIQTVHTTKDYQKDSFRQIYQCPSSVDRYVRTNANNRAKADTPPCPNIYETVVPATTVNSSAGRSTPIYEAEWTHNLKHMIMSRIPSFERSSLASAPSTQYFHQQQHPYDRFLATRGKASDSMRRNKMLKRLKDDAAFLY